uniref:Uncharacterized protein n=1 Tax=Onchocerca volvulus TaxID=6282 RepID=A0A8R1TJD5_ONCVO
MVGSSVEKEDKIINVQPLSFTASEYNQGSIPQYPTVPFCKTNLHLEWIGGVDAGWGILMRDEGFPFPVQTDIPSSDACFVPSFGYSAIDV